jgi:hypothetical protein
LIATLLFEAMQGGRTFSFKAESLTHLGIRLQRCDG